MSKACLTRLSFVSNMYTQALQKYLLVEEVMKASTALLRLGYTFEITQEGSAGYAKTVLGKYRLFLMPLHGPEIECWSQAVRCVCYDASKAVGWDRIFTSLIEGLGFAACLSERDFYEEAFCERDAARNSSSVQL